MEIILKEIKPDILVLTEHKLKVSEVKCVKIEDYTVQSSYCRRNYCGGGVMILSSNNVKVEPLNIPEINQLRADKIFECCMVKCKIGDISFILVGIYRTPGYNFDEPFLESLEKALEILLNVYKYVIVCGDFNIDVLKKSRVVSKLTEILKQYNMYYLVDFPTRITIESESAIDNFLSNIPQCKLSISGVVTELSDHDAQLLEIKPLTKSTSCGNQPVKTSRKYSEENKSIFLSLLKKETWLDLYQAPVEAKFDTFHSIFMYYFNLAFPLSKSRAVQKKDKWITNDLISQKEEIICLSQSFRLTKDITLKKLLREKQKSYKSNLINTKKEFISNKIKKSANICKTTWEIINKETRDTPEYNKEVKLNIDDNLISDPFVLSESFNNYFTNVVKNLVLPEIPNCVDEPVPYINSTSKFHTVPLSESELDAIISSFENKFSVGYDEVPMPVIKHSKMYLIRPILHVINCSFITGVFPEMLKISRIKSVFKKGDKTDPVNYRPISVLTSFSKIFERAMSVRLVEFLEKDNLFDNEQHGFRSNRSVITAGVELIESIVTAIDGGEKAVGVFMDLTKAFDSVCHDKLLNILENLGINGRYLNWFKTYLVGRKQFVELTHVNNFNQIIKVQSKMRISLHGVPQGSILGPVLFLCYLKGLPNSISDVHSKLVLYADDSNLVVRGKVDTEILINRELSAIKNFFDSRNLLLNSNKTNFIVFHTRQDRNKQTQTVKINSNEISQVKYTKFLGLIVDETLTWNSHVENLTHKISSGIYILRNFANLCSIDILKMLYYAHIHSHLSYGIVLYGATSNYNLNKLLILQKKALKIMFKLKSDDSVKDIFCELGILTVYGLYVLETVMAVRVDEINLPKLGSNHNYSTRNKNKLAIPSHSLTFFWKSPKIAGLKFYHKIPQSLKEIKSVPLFKIKLKQYLTSKSLYSFDEL